MKGERERRKILQVCRLVVVCVGGRVCVRGRVCEVAENDWFVGLIEGGKSIGTSFSLSVALFVEYTLAQMILIVIGHKKKEEK